MKGKLADLLGSKEDFKLPKSNKFKGGDRQL
jgi:hypothetical protein